MLRRFENGYTIDENLQMMSVFLDKTDIGIYVADYNTCEILYLNKKVLDYNSEIILDDLIGEPCWQLIDRRYTKRCPFCPYKNLIGKDGSILPPYMWELYVPRVDVWLKVINQIITWTDGRLVHMVTFYDITELKLVYKHEAELAFFDKLLQIKNASKLEQDTLEAPLKPSLIIFDITSLRGINEAYNRRTGDRLLLSIRDWVLRENFQNSELYRLGGDEFCLTVSEARNESLIKMADKIRRRFHEPWEFEYGGDKLSIYCNASIAAVLCDFITDEEPLLNLIDRTLEVAKKKTGITIYDEKLDFDFKEQLRFDSDLRKCVQSGMTGFEVFYQPIVDATSGLWCGVEALCRWNRPNYGMVSPLLFIPVAERCGLIGTIGLWVMETAVKNCKSWGLDKYDSFLLDVNVSPVQFLDEMFSEKIDKILKTHDYPYDKLCLEITEGTRFLIREQTLKVINQLRKGNIKVALDDFGTGYTNFYQLKNIPVDILKIEKDFITDIESDSYQQYLLGLMIDLSHSINMNLIVEGVETKSQFDILIKSGANKMQGYLFSKPLSPADFINKLQHFETT